MAYCIQCKGLFKGRLYKGKRQIFCSMRCRINGLKEKNLRLTANKEEIPPLTPGNIKLIKKLAGDMYPIGQVHSIMDPLCAIQREAVSREYYNARQV